MVAVAAGTAAPEEVVPEAPGRAATGRARLLVAVAAVALLGWGVFVAVTYDGRPTDEASHLDYIRHVAEDHRLPILATPTDDTIEAMREGTYPGPPALPAGRRGLASTVYEAFQPPLYYLLAAPLWLVPVGAPGKVLVIRLFGLALYAGAVALFAQLCRDVAGRRWGLALGFGMLFFLQPGNVVRAVTVGNEALDLPLGVAVTLALWRALDRRPDERPDRSARWTLVAAVLVGLGVLTKLTFAAFALPLLGVIAWRWWDGRRSSAGGARLAAVATVPALLVAPWLLWNRRQYGTFTSNSQARDLQMPIINPDGRVLGRTVFLDRTPAAFDSLAPQDWVDVGGQAVPTVVRWLLLAGVYALPAVFLCRPAVARALGRRALLAVPLVATWALLAWTTLFEQWDVMLFRYTRPAMPAWFLLAFLVWHDDDPAHDRVKPLGTVLAVGVAAVWWSCTVTYL